MPTMTDDMVRRLAEIRPGTPMLSLYLDLDPSQFGTQAARGSAIRSLLDRAHREVEQCDTDHEGRQALREDLKRVDAFFRGEFSAKGARAMAIFSAVGAGVFEAIPLARPIESRVVLNHTPYVEPLLGATDPRDWLVVLVNRRDGRLLRGNTERLEEVDRVSDEVHQRHDQGGWSQANYQRSIGADIDVHLQHVAETIDRRFKRDPFERLLLGGPGDIVPRLQARLGANLRDRVVGRIDIDVSTATVDDVLTAAAPCFEAHERLCERDALDRLAQGLGSSGRAVAGPEAVHEALTERRVEILLYDDGYDPPEEHALETAVEEALAQSAQVIRVRHHADLDEHGHIGAVLRF